MIEQIIGDVMTPSVQTVPPEATACDVATLFDDRDIASAIVTDSQTGEYSGIVTDSDIMCQVETGADTESVRVRTFLSAPLVTIASTQDIHTAATLMKEHSIQRLPVTEGDDLVGMLTVTELTPYMPRLRNTLLRGRNELVGQ